VTDHLGVEDGGYQCSLCSESFVTRWGRDIHENIQHEPPVTEEIKTPGTNGAVNDGRGADPDKAKLCSGGCGCVADDDADRRECGCDGPCTSGWPDRTSGDPK
jgi:hypothetical protein